MTKKNIYTKIVFVLLASIKNLEIGYNFKSILRPINLDIKVGQKILICGSNGCGKTTFLKTLLGTVKPISGTIDFFENKKISYCKQDSLNMNLPITAREVVELGTYKNKKTKEFIEECMKKTECLELQNRLFNTLSGGEKQRVSLARCLCQDSNFLLLDEPSSFLDIKSKQTFIDLLKSLDKEKISIISVTHDLDVIKTLNWDVINFTDWRI